MVRGSFFKTPVKPTLLSIKIYIFIKDFTAIKGVYDSATLVEIKSQHAFQTIVIRVISKTVFFFLFCGIIALFILCFML